MVEKQAKKEKKAYVLVIDEERNGILDEVLKAIIHSYESYSLFKMILLKRNVKGEVFDDFLEEVSNKEHEMGWCADPNCNHNETK